MNVSRKFTTNMSPGRFQNGSKTGHFLGEPGGICETSYHLFSLAFLKPNCVMSDYETKSPKATSCIFDLIDHSPEFSGYQVSPAKCSVLGQGRNLCCGIYFRAHGYIILSSGISTAVTFPIYFFRNSP